MMQVVSIHSFVCVVVTSTSRAGSDGFSFKLTQVSKDLCTLAMLIKNQHPSLHLLLLPLTLRAAEGVHPARLAYAMSVGVAYHDATCAPVQSSGR